MNRIKEAFDIRRISKLMWNENVGIILLMILSGICHRFRDIHPILENGSVFLVFLGFLSLAIVEGKNLVSKWNKSSKRGFLTLGNIIGLVFLSILLVGGAYTTFIIFYVKDFLTADFLGIFGIIWTLRWIQKLKNFSSIRDDVHKLIGPLIAIVILISGYALHSKNPAFGPLSCVLAPAMMWFCSLIFGDIKGRSNDQDDETNLFAIIISIILLGLVIYAIRNPEIYGIEIPSVDGEFFKDLCKINGLQYHVKSYAERLQDMKDRLEYLKNEINPINVVDENSFEMNEIRKEIENLEKDIVLDERFLEDSKSGLQSLQRKINLSEKLVESPRLIKSMIGKIRKFGDANGKPRSLKDIGKTIAYHLRRNFKGNKETHEAE